MKSYQLSLGKDRVETHIYKALLPPLLPRFIRNFMSMILPYFGGNIASKILQSFGLIDVHSLWLRQHEHYEYQQMFRDHFDESGIDFLICPVNANTAVPHDSFSDLSATASYTFFYNYVNFSCGVTNQTSVLINHTQVVPVTKVDKLLDQKDKLEPKEFHDKKSSFHYDPTECHNLPVGIQVVGGYFEDEKTLQAMKIVESVVNYHYGPNKEQTSN